MLPQATQENNAVFDPAAQQIQGQVPAIQQLYSALLNGLQGQQANQLNFVNNSAAQRGVSSAGITAGAENTLANSLALAQGQLGAQQAGDISNIQGQAGKLNTARAQAVGDYSGTLNKQNVAAGQNNLAQQELTQKYTQQQLNNQRDFNVKQVAYQTAQAQAAARAAASAAKQAAAFDISTVGKDTVIRQLRLNLKGVEGKDGHVSPENLAKAYNTWAAAGLPAPEFWKNFQGVWNSKQGNYGDQFHYFVNKGA